MIKRICNRCEKELKNKTYYELDIMKWNRGGMEYANSETRDYFPKLFDLCEDCYKDLLKFLGESN